MNSEENIGGLRRSIGIYIHIPFCKSKCIYCDFVSFENKQDLINNYIDCVKTEITQIAEGNKQDYKNGLDELINVKTIYIGGGTPSNINSKYIIEILSLIKKHFIVKQDLEITIEINPGTIDKQKLQDYFNVGINRLSIGLQETHTNLLNIIGRNHTFEDFIKTYKLARKIGFKNINIDLIIGLPNQTLKNIEESAKEVIKLNPEHISVYSLILEENTKLNDLIKEKKLQLPDEQIERKMYWLIKEKLEKSDYNHYEISNFSKHGFESKHNIDCWNQKEYIGIGVSAHSYTNGIRYSNIESIEKYIANFQSKNELDNLIFHEKQTQKTMMKEYMLLGLRNIKGISIKKFKGKFIENPIYVFREQLQKLSNENLLEIDNDNIKLTKKGIDLANLVWQEFV